MTEPLLAGRVIAITADRRCEEQASLFEKRGARVLHAPTLKTLDLSHSDALREVTDGLIAAPPDLLIATTGMGMRMWLAAADGWGVRARLVEAIGSARIVARGAKSASAMRGAGFEVAWQAPTERMDDIVDWVAGQDLRGTRAAVQLFDVGSHTSAAALRRLVASLVEVPVYQWALPDAPAPVHELIDAVVAGGVDAVTFTSQPAVHHLFRIAEAAGRRHDLREAMAGDLLVACIGPVCAEALVDEGIADPAWPEPPRLAAMVRLVTDRLTA